LRLRVAVGASKAALAREFGISGDTLYRYVPVKERRAGKFAKRIACSESEEGNDERIGMQAELDHLRAENAQLKSKDMGGLTLKVSEKGRVSLCGMGRFPVTLYKERWHGLDAEADRFLTTQCAAVS
jgi:transposase-like protein